MARGCILKRRNKDGSTTYSIKYRTADGKQVKRAAGKTRSEAHRALTAALADLDRGRVRASSRETFADAAARWLARKEPRLEVATYQDYERHLRLRLLPSFGTLQLRQVTRRHVDDYVHNLDRAGSLSRKTINDSLIPLRQILGMAVRDGVIPVNPAVSADRDAPVELPYERPVMSYMTREQAHRYLDAAPAAYRPLAEVLLGAGLRIGEALALEWEDVDWDGQALLINKSFKVGGVGTPKGDRARGRRGRVPPPRTAAASRGTRPEGGFGSGLPPQRQLHPPSVGAPVLAPRNPRGRRPAAVDPPTRSSTHRCDAVAGIRAVHLLRPAATRP